MDAHDGWKHFAGFGQGIKLSVRLARLAPTLAPALHSARFAASWFELMLPLSLRHSLSILSIDLPIAHLEMLREETELCWHLGKRHAGQVRLAYMKCFDFIGSV